MPGIGLFALLGLLQAAAPLQAQPTTRYPELTPERIRADVSFLADDLLEGRSTTTRGGRIAARYVEARFRSGGLAPPDGRHVHPFPDGYLELEPESTLLTIVSGGSIEEIFSSGEMFLPHPSSPEGEASGRLVFGGYGLYAPEHDYDDLYGLDLRGKVVLLFRWEPQLADRDSRFLGRRLLPESRLSRKVAECARRGASAVLVANPPGESDEREAPCSAYWPSASTFHQQLKLTIEAQLDPSQLAKTNFEPAQVADQFFTQLQFSSPLGTNIPVGYVSATVVERVFESVDMDPATWRREVDASGVGEGFETMLKARIQIRHKPAERIGWNVMGLLPGSDPVLSEEYVVVGAHYDHVGRNEMGEIWNGADDNASGTALLLNLADSFAFDATAPKRSLLFVAFSGEEHGLLGSARFLADPPVPAGRIVAMVNLDMVGRALNRRLYVVGVRSASSLRRIIERSSEGLGLFIDFESDEFFDRSDQAAFYYSGIPVVFFNTAQHPDYHTPADTWEKIDYAAASDIAVLARRAVQTLAGLDQAPVFEDGYNRFQAVYGREAHLTVPTRIPFEQRLDY